MQTEVANILHNKLLDLVDGNVITHHCGLVRKVDTKLLSGGQKFDQVPVPYQTTEAECCADGWSYLVPDATKRYYQRKFSEGKEPVPFLFIPHILYK